MKKMDGRTLSHEASEALRKIAVRRVASGEKPSTVIASLGMCRTSIYRWLRAYRRGGEGRLVARKASGRRPTLTRTEKAKVRTWICGKTPGQYGFDFGLWTRKIVADLIEQKFKKKLSVTAVGHLLGELGITPQKPLRRAYERDPIAIERWKNETFPALRQRAKQRQADIFFLDEAGLRSDCVLQRTWAPRGKTPAVPTSGRRQAVNAISAVSALGAFWFTIFFGTLNAATFIEFLRAFLSTRKKPVFLIVDGHPAHRAKLVAEFVQTCRGSLELHFLPGYAPELNPDEFVWNDLRQRGVSKRPLKKDESLADRVLKDLTDIGNDEDRVRSYFRAEPVAYISH